MDLEKQLNDLKNKNIDDFDIFDAIFNQDTIKKEKIINCKECKSNELIKKDGYIICSNCGLENDIILDRAVEYITDETNNNTRVGCASNPFLPLSSMGTKISGPYNKISNIHNKWYRMVYKERSLLNVFSIIDEKCKKYNINKPIIDNAKIFFKKINDSTHTSGKNKGKQRIVRGINRVSLIAACIFHGAEMQGTPRSQKEIAEVCNLNVTDVTKGCRKFREILQNDEILSYLEPANHLKYIIRYGEKLNIDKKYIDKCIEISNNIIKLDIASDHQPPSIAAGCIMLISDIYKLNINIKYISSEFKISEVTIKKTFKKLDYFKELITSTEKVNEKLKELEDFYS